MTPTHNKNMSPSPTEMTPLDRFVRLHWIPFLPSDDAVCDGRPQTVRLFGETLVAFRASDGSIGLVDNACPHRGAPLVFGRNEDCGLRCVYHGWKFRTDGSVADMPAEPARSRLKDRMRIKSYPCMEKDGLVWAYLGSMDQSERPPLPELPFGEGGGRSSTFRVVRTPWANAMEGCIDGVIGGAVAPDAYRGISSRVTADGLVFVRESEVVLDFKLPFVLASRGEDAGGRGAACIPIDAENTLCVLFGAQGIGVEAAAPRAHVGIESPLSGGGFSDERAFQALLTPYASYAMDRPSMALVEQIKRRIARQVNEFARTGRPPAYLNGSGPNVCDEPPSGMVHGQAQRQPSSQSA
jgi:nitrite reductase/ring-hydroxylating ferredoxin subunit